jgi:LPS-assembly protein
MRLKAWRLALKAAASVLAMCAGASLAHAQRLNNFDVKPAKPVPAAPLQNNERMVVDANEIVYDNKGNKVSAVGNVQIFHKGRTIEADRVVYDRNTKRVQAQGNARITEANGTVITGDRFDLDDGFKNGFIDSLRVENTDKTRFTAPRAERTEGQSMVFESGIYTACEPCKDNPERPPLWQVRSARIIHDAGEKMVYYEGSQIEFWGVPIAYIPYFSGPDATVKRKSGFLSPHYITTTALGYGVSTPYFWNLAPNYDLTLTPTFFTRQGFLGQAEWRHRILNGSYNIRAAGISQAEPSAFLVSPYGAREKDFRGSIESSGKFHINEKWSYGWDIALATDRWFIQNYRLKSESLTNTFFRESTSTVFLNGKTDTGWFDLRGYYFRTLYYTDWQKQQPIVHPVLDYDKRHRGPGWLGGEIAVNANITSLSRDAAMFQQIPRQNTYLFSNTLGSLYDTCAVFQRGTCLLRGVGGQYSRATVEVAWRRNIIDGLGQVWTPYASLRGDGVFAEMDTTKYQNAQQANFVNPNGDNYGRVLPTVGLTYRYPFVASNSWGTHIIEPIAQIAARPNEGRIRTTFNEDAQSLVFDDTNLFSFSKFSGYDRTEGGVRANVGMQYTGHFGKNAYANMMFGQSYHLAGTNSYNPGDLVNTGRNSGLERDKSDYVGGAQISPGKGWLFSAKGRFDQDGFTNRRGEVSASYTHEDKWATSLTYARYDRQPEIGFDRRREGLYISQMFNVTGGWSVRGSVLFDMDKYLLDRETFITNYNNWVSYPGVFAQPRLPKSDPLYPTTVALGIQYRDECTIFDVNYTRSRADKFNGGKQDGHTLLFRLELRTLGGVNYTQRFGNTATTQDGISN